MDFQSAATLVLRPTSEDLRKEGGHVSGKSSPLDFLVEAAETQNTVHGNKRWITTVSDGRERITVVPGPSGVSIRLHKGNGRLPPVDFSKPFARKCRNRECNNLCGQPGKPRSIYCSKRCQSREQNLRQGRIKNVRSPTNVIAVSSPSTPNLHSPGNQATPINERGHSLSPLPRNSSPDSVPEEESSPEMDIQSSPSVSPVPFHVASPQAPSPLTVLSNPSPIPPLNLTPTPTTMGPPTQINPSPLTIRLGMTPSPIPMSPSPISMSHSSGFSPVPMSAAIPQNHANHLHLPKPSPIHSFASPTGLSSQPNKDKNNISLQSGTFSPPQSKLNSPPINSQEEKKDGLDSLTLAPMRS